MNTRPNYYSTLVLPDYAPSQQIENAHAFLISRWKDAHARNDPTAQKRQGRTSNAYGHLKNLWRRAWYNAELEATNPPRQINDLFRVIDQINIRDLPYPELRQGYAQLALAMLEKHPNWMADSRLTQRINDIDKQLGHEHGIRDLCNFYIKHAPSTEVAGICISFTRSAADACDRYLYNRRAAAIRRMVSKRPDIIPLVKHGIRRNAAFDHSLVNAGRIFARISRRTAKQHPSAPAVPSTPQQKLPPAKVIPA